VETSAPREGSEIKYMCELPSPRLMPSCSPREHKSRMVTESNTPETFCASSRQMSAGTCFEVRVVDPPRPPGPLVPPGGVSSSVESSSIGPCTARITSPSVIDSGVRDRK
jgi:hypothetical protein